MIKSYRISDVDCAACAAKIEHKISKIKGVESAVLSFMSKKLTVEFENDNVSSHWVVLKRIRWFMSLKTALSRN